jgi:hypothetical protein
MIYEKYCTVFSNLPNPWIEFASFEYNLEEIDRCKQILTIAQQTRVEGVPDPEEFIANAQAEAEQEDE